VKLVRAVYAQLKVRARGGRRRECLRDDLHHFVRVGVDEQVTSRDAVALERAAVLVPRFNACVIDYSYKRSKKEVAQARERDMGVGESVKK
jgi:hypothetical protein